MRNILEFRPTISLQGVLIASLVAMTTPVSAQFVSFEVRPDKRVVQMGERVEISVLVADQRLDAPGILSAFLDLNYDESLLQVIPESFSFGPNFEALGKHDLTSPGIVDESGAFVTGILSLPPIPSGIGGDSEVLFSVTFEAITVGEAVLSTDHADNLPVNATTLLGIDSGLSEQEIEYGTTVVRIVPEPSSHRLLPFAMLSLLSLRRKQNS